MTLPLLNSEAIAELLAIASGPVSYVSDVNIFGARTTATVSDGRWTRKQHASDFMRELLYVPPAPKEVVVATGKRSEPYTGPFPRGRHSHRCVNCGGNAVACYKAKCTVPQTTGTCKYCR